MYLRHFGLREQPFSLTPDTHYFLGCPSHREALNLLLFALRSGEGFAKLVGEVGTGKTLLCRKLLNDLGSRFVSAYVPNPPASPEALLACVARELGVAVAEGEESHQTLQRLNECLLEHAEQGRSVVVVLDEAQALPTSCLEAVRLLSNLETERRKLLQVVLFGQPELDARLATPSLRQMLQRISFAYRLRPLRRDEVGVYLEHRLRVAGYEGMPLFAPAAVAALARASGGTPRLVNVLAHKALLCAFGRGDHAINVRDVRRAAFDTEGVRRARASFRPSWWLARLALLASGLGLLATLAGGGA